MVMYEVCVLDNLQWNNGLRLLLALTCYIVTFYFFGSFSNALAICSTVRSSYMRPTIIIPHGSPSENPAFIVRAGCPVLLNGAVFLTILKDKSNASVNNKTINHIKLEWTDAIEYYGIYIVIDQRKKYDHAIKNMGCCRTIPSPSFFCLLDNIKAALICPQSF